MNILGTNYFEKYSPAFFLVVVLLSVTMGCSSTLVENEEKGNSMFDDKLRNGSMAEGESLKPFYFNDYLIAGRSQSIVDTLKQTQFESTIRTLGLEPIHADQKFSNAEIIILKRIDGASFSYRDNSILKTLREQFGNDFGPVLLDSNKTLLGGLKNQIVVRFHQEVSDSLANEIISSYGGTGSDYMSGDNSYLIDFPLDLGFYLIDVGKKLLADERINYCQNEVFHGVKTFGDMKSDQNGLWKVNTHFLHGVEEEILTNDNLLVTFVSTTAFRQEKFDSVMNDYGFQLDPTYSAASSEVDLFGNPNKRSYFVFKTNDGSQLKTKDWRSIEDDYPGWIGALVFSQSKSIIGQLLPEIDLEFNATSSLQEREKLVSRYNGTIMHRGEKYYTVLFKDIWSYEILEHTNRINQEEIIVSVNNRYRAQNVSY